MAIPTFNKNKSSMSNKSAFKSMTKQAQSNLKVPSPQKTTHGVPTSPRSAGGSTNADNRELKRRGRKRVRDDIYF